MGLFSKRSAPVVDPGRGLTDIEWMPVDGVTELEGDAAHMDDDGQAIDAGDYFAYRVEHEMPNLPGAMITVWTYVCYIGRDAYGVGLRYQYTIAGDPGWSYVGYETDPQGDEFDTNSEADATAADWAGGIGGPGDWQPRLPGVFDWDGEPFALPG